MYEFMNVFYEFSIEHALGIKEYKKCSNFWENEGGSIMAHIFAFIIEGNKFISSILFYC